MMRDPDAFGLALSGAAFVSGIIGLAGLTLPPLSASPVAGLLLLAAVGLALMAYGLALRPPRDRS